MTLDKSSYDCTGGSCTGFYKDEIYTPKELLASWINGDGNITDPQTGITYACNSFAEPGGQQDATSVSAVKTSGYLGGRPLGSPLLTRPDNLMSFHLYKNGGLAVANWKGSTEAQTIQNINAVAAYAASGKVVFLLAHNTSEMPTTGANSWETVLNTLYPWKNAGRIKIQSAQKTYNELLRSPWTYSDATGYATRSYSSYNDFHLVSGSPAIRSGTNVGLTTDYAGRPWKSTPSIGAYEYFSQQGGGFSGMNFNLGW